MKRKIRLTEADIYKRKKVAYRKNGGETEYTLYNRK